MTHTSMRRGRLVLLAAVTILVVLAGGSAAAKVITGEPDEQSTPRTSQPQYVTESVDVAKISSATAVAPCPAGTRAIDGGVSSDSEPFTRVDTSTADVDGSGWRVELWNQHPIEGLTVHVWAACLAIG
jgi:hypothetical protein